MKPPLADLSIRGKLIVIISATAIVAVAAAAIAVIIRDVRGLRREMVAQTQLIARLAGDYSVSALAFRDPRAATEALSKLEWMAEIDCARLVDADGRPFAAYERTAAVPRPVLVEPAAEFTADHLFVAQPIEFQGERYGGIVICASTRDLHAEIRNSLMVVGGLMAALIVLAVAIAFRLQRLISRPIVELARIAHRVSSTANYSIRAEVAGDDEIGGLSRAWNEMLSQIERRNEDRKTYEEALQASNRKLERYTAELERSNRELDQFAYVVSHDLKAPLRGIINVSNWLEEDLANTLQGDNLRQLQLLRNRTERMEGLIDGILEYSRVIRVRPEAEKVDVAKLLVELMEDLAPPPGFQVRIADGMPILMTQRVRLRQVFSNLLSNAIKYHHRQDGRVDVTVETTVEQDVELYAFEIRDDGPGIPEDCHQKIFRIFQTLVPRDTQESTGIGLAIVQKIVEEQGGRITVEAEEGMGSTFRFTWPKAPRATEGQVIGAGMPGRYALPNDVPWLAPAGSQ